MVTADQLVCHAIGDYLLQSDWMALNKTKRWGPAIVHATTYALPFLFLHPSALALLIIIGTHAVIDRLRMARFVVWAKNWLAPWRGEIVEPKGWDGCSPRVFRWARPNPPFADCSATGYPADRPVWLTTWLLIIADNVLHVVINAAALRWAVK